MMKSWCLLYYALLGVKHLLDMAVAWVRFLEPSCGRIAFARPRSIWLHVGILWLPQNTNYLRTSTSSNQSKLNGAVSNALVGG